QCFILRLISQNFIFIMDYLTYTKRLEYILELIQKNRLESPEKLAIKFECSEKTIRNMINVLRSQGLDIQYSKSLKKYILKNQ
ncbi:MAG: HTH domain-containing protein, partial [bacterium]